MARTKPDYSDRIDPSVGRVPHDYTEDRGPITVSWHWTSNGREHQLVWTRSPEPMLYGVQDAEGKWITTVARHPKMAGIDKISDARDVAEWFINGHMLPEHDWAYEQGEDD